MIYLVIGIICNVLLFVILKGFGRFRVPALQGIVVNYFVAGGTAFLFMQEPVLLREFYQAPWFWLSILLGALFISIFFLISLTSKNIGISVASVANKMSMVIPVIAAFILYDDSAGTMKIAGLVLALLAVYFTVKPNKEELQKNGSSGAWLIILPLIVFIGSGIIDGLVNYATLTHLPSASKISKFIGFTFFVSGTIGAIILCGGLLLKKMKFGMRSLAGGIVLGVPNYFSIYFVMLAIQETGLESSVIYPIVNMGVVLGSALAGVLLFREKLSKWNYAGIALSVLAIAMIAGLLGG
jgi:drug/metabolite transporter (DMT)-like permease